MQRPWARPLCLLLACAAGRAHAEGPPPPEAKQAFSDGKSAYERGEYERALSLFQRAESIAPAPSLHYNIGMAYERLSRWEESARAFDLYLAQIDPPATDDDRAFQSNLRARAAANHERARRASQEAPPQALVEPPVQPQPQRPGYAQPYPYYGYGYGYGYPPPPIPQLTRKQRIDTARHHRNNGVALTTVGLTFVVAGAIVLAYGTTEHGSESIGLVIGGASGLVLGVPLMIPGAVAWAHWQKVLDQERKSPEDGSTARRAALDVAVPMVAPLSGATQLVFSTPAVRF